jgi:putative mycofactocin binding protein MftB
MRTRWILDPACRVRRERFGLLFYDLRGPRLLFAETGDLLSPELLREGGDAREGRTGAERVRVERLLRSLVEKGYVREQPVC